MTWSAVAGATDRARANELFDLKSDEMSDMSLFDAFKEKAAELFGGAGDKVTELTGIEVPGTEAVDQFGQSADQVTQTAGGFVEGAGEAGQNLAGTAQDFGTTATDAAGDFIDPHTQR